MHTAREVHAVFIHDNTVRGAQVSPRKPGACEDTGSTSEAEESSRLSADAAGVVDGVGRPGSQKHSTSSARVSSDPAAHPKADT